MRKIKPNMEMHCRVVRHIGLAGILPHISKQEILGIVSNIIHPKFIAYIYYRRVKDQGTFTMALLDDAPAVTTNMWEGVFPKEILAKEGNVKVSIGECLPTRNEIDWYKFNKSDEKIPSHSTNSVGGGRGRGNSGRGSMRGTTTYRDTLRESGFHSTHLGTQNNQKRGKKDSESEIASRYVHK
jgi:hypothetical protein